MPLPPLHPARTPACSDPYAPLFSEEIICGEWTNTITRTHGIRAMRETAFLTAFSTFTPSPVTNLLQKNVSEIGNLKLLQNICRQRQKNF
jgi:hypothetical protein